MALRITSQHGKADDVSLFELFYYQIDQEMPKKFKGFEILHLKANIITFMDQFMNDTRYMESFEQLSKKYIRLLMVMDY